MRTYCWLSYRRLNSMSSRRSHVASFAASVKAMYSALIDDKATVGCFWNTSSLGHHSA